MTCVPSRSGVRSAAAFGLAALAVCALLMATSAAAMAYAAEKERTRAERALREGEYELAERIFREALAKDARDTSARLGLSYALLKLRRLQDAYDHAARVIAVEPLSARAHALLGSAILASGDFLLAVEEFRTALTLKDDEALAIAGLAMVDFYENRLSASISGLRRAAFIDPKEPDYIFNLAQAAARSERYKESADAYERFLAVAPRTDADRRARIRGLIDFLRYLGARGSLYVPTGSSQTVVQFESPDNRPMIRVRVNGGKETLRFVLDTGSGISVISEETARLINLKPVARGGLARAVGGGGRFEIVYGFLQSMEIGEVRVENVPVYIRRFYDQQNRVDGYIGLAVISKFLTTVDYGARTFALSRSRSPDIFSPWRGIYKAENAGDAANPPAGVEIPIRTTSSGFISGEVRLDGFGKPLNFILDTGASISVVSEKLALREEMSSIAQGVRMKVYGAAGVAEDVKTFVLPRIAIGAQARAHISAAVLDLEPINETAGFEQTGILGGNFLRHFRVTFDFQRALVRLEPLAGASPPPPRPAPSPSPIKTGTLRP